MPESPFEHQRRRRQMWRNSHGRMTDSIGFEVPINVQWLADKDPYVLDELPREAVDEAVWSAADSGVDDGLDPVLYNSDSGRGASGVAVAIEYAVDYVNSYGGATALLIQTAYGVRALWRRLSTALGRHPNVSLGASTHLAAADLADRLGGATDFELFGNHDLQDASQDSSYTGEDVFLASFAHGKLLYLYAVQPDGRTDFLGQIDRPDPRGLLDI